MRLWVAALLLFLVAGCAKFTVQTPAQFLVLDEPGGDDAYAYRATSADGVVLAVRDVANEPYGDLDFWADAMGARLRLAKGYAVLEENEVRAASGEKGLRVRFGRDEHGKQYLYTVTLFVTDRHVFVVEAGGRRERVEARQKAVDAALASFRIRGLGTRTTK